MRNDELLTVPMSDKDVKKVDQLYKQLENDPGVDTNYTKFKEALRNTKEDDCPER